MEAIVPASLKQGKKADMGLRFITAMSIRAAFWKH